MNINRKAEAIAEVRTALRDIASQPKPRQVVVVNSVKRIAGKGALKGFATVTLGGKVVIHGCRIIHAEGREAWVSLPQTEVPAKAGGKSIWYPVVEITDKNLKRAIQDAVLIAWKVQPEGIE